MELFWFLPTYGDGRFLGTATGSREATLGYLKQVAIAAEELGFGGVLVPSGKGCDDAWIVASTLAAVTRKLRFLVALRPGIIAPAAAARMASALDRYSDGRLLLNVVTGGDPAELAGDGVHLSHADRYRQTDEFLTVFRKLFTEAQVDYKGDFFHLSGAELLQPPRQRSYPPLFLGGSSAAAHAITAEHIDVYLTWGEPPAQVAEKIGDIRARAEQRGRKVRFGIRLHTVVRKSTDEAWDAANALLEHVDEHTIAQAQETLARFDSEGQKRLLKLHGGSRDKLEISPNLWSGISLVRGGAGTALVGDGPTVAERMREYAALGIDYFVLSGIPHLEEAYHFHEHVFPHLPVPQKEREVPNLPMGMFGDRIRSTASV